LEIAKTPLPKRKKGKIKNHGLRHLEKEAKQPSWRRRGGATDAAGERGSPGRSGSEAGPGAAGRRARAPRLGRDVAAHAEPGEATVRVQSLIPASIFFPGLVNKKN
jgi:hypothetical protein